MKLKIISVIIVILILLMNVSVFADEFIPDPPSDVWEYWVIVQNSPNYFYLYASHSPITVSTRGHDLYLSDGQQKYTLDYGGDTWEKKFERDGQESYYFETMIKSNHDIAYEDGSGFFFLRPKILRLTQAAKTTDFGMILRNFSVGLIPIVGLIVSAVGLRKALEFLRNQLMS